MSALLTVLKKELTDAFRDRRMVMVAFVVMPLVFPLIFAGLGTLGAKKQTEKLENMLELPVIGADRAPNLIAWLEQNNVKVLPPPADADAAVRSQERDVVLRIDEAFGDAWRGSRPARVELVYDSSRPLQSGTTIARTRALLTGYAEQMGTLRLVARGIHPSVAKPLRVASRDLATPEARFDFGQQMIPYLMILLGFIGGMQLAIDSTAGERERQSLEPLLATPASREAILSGKIIATAVFAFLSVFTTLIAYKVAFTYVVTSRAGGFSMNLPTEALLQMFLVLLPVLLLGAALLTALAAFAKSYREAQSYLPMIMFLPMIPTMYLMVSPVKNQLWMMAIPFLSQNQLILKVLRKEAITMEEWIVCLGAGLLLTAIVWFVAARLYHREQLAVSA
jgi:sodium transport system permease protein